MKQWNKPAICHDNRNKGSQTRPNNVISIQIHLKINLKYRGRRPPGGLNIAKSFLPKNIEHCRRYIATFCDMETKIKFSVQIENTRNPFTNQSKHQNVRFGKFNYAIWRLLWVINYTALQIINYENLKRPRDFGDIGSFGDLSTGKILVKNHETAEVFRRYWPMYKI